MITINFTRVPNRMKDVITINNIPTDAVLFYQSIEINNEPARVLAGIIDNVVNVLIGDTVLYNNETYYIFHIEAYFNMKKIYLTKDLLFKA